MTKNIYNLFREYNRLLTPPQKAKYLASMNYDTRETFKRLINYANNSGRFENIYDGWIDNLDDELVVLEVYSVILSTRKNLQKFCVDDKTYKDFIENKKKMLTLLLKNKQYKHASTLLDVHMFSEGFKQNKLEELREKVLKYLVSKRVTLPKKLINEIYNWAEKHKLPLYLITDIDGDFKFSITNDILSTKTLQEDVERELKSIKLEKIVNNLVEKNGVK